jgi:superfamily I DNA and/or RNA helicase
MRQKQSLEDQILKESRIIITTCKSSYSRRLKDIQFRKVIVDEAAQSSEVETLEALR